MPVDLNKVRAALKPGGFIKFNNNNIRDDSETVVKGQWDAKVHDLYRMAVAKIEGSTLHMTGTTDSDNAANAVKVVFEDGCATIGSVLPPGIIYSDSFSGCVFYLYRGGVGHIYGVHANRSGGKLADPNGWFLKRGGKCIYKWDSKGVVTAGMFGAVVVCLEKTKLDVFALEMNKQKINRVISHSEIKNWPSMPMIK